MFLRLFTTSGDGIPSFVSFISLLGPLVGLTLGFDAINGERSRGTLNLLIAQPIHRDAVINGKFLAGLTVIAGMVCALGLLISGIDVYKRQVEIMMTDTTLSAQNIPPSTVSTIDTGATGMLVVPNMQATLTMLNST